MSDARSFSSALSVNRHLGTHAAGLEPLAIVAGSSIYHVGWQMPLWSRAGELTVVTQSLTEARILALGRLREVAVRLGADGVVGVTLDIRPNSPGARLTQIIATGTAVRSALTQFNNSGGTPFMSSLSGQEISLLMRGGFRPLALAAGTCVYHAGYQGVGRWFSQIGKNLEMPTLTQALSDARELALDRMQTEAMQSGASGVLGIALTEHAHEFGSHVVECFALGTAIGASGEAAPLGDLPFILSLSDPPSPPAPVVEPPPVIRTEDSVDVSGGIG